MELKRFSARSIVDRGVAPVGCGSAVDPSGSFARGADATAALAGFMINGNSIGKASFTAKSGRAKAK